MSLFTPAEIQQIRFDGTVASVHKYLHEFVQILQAKSRKKKISNKQLRLALVKAFVQQAQAIARIDLNLEATLELLSDVINEEAGFDRERGNSKEPLL
jgi:hypothetical protein